LTDVGDCWPLSDEQLSIINASTEKLNELLDTDSDLIGDMRATDCLSRRQIDHLYELPYEGERNNKLLDMMKRRSISQFNQFIECLDKNQRHLVPFFTGDEGNDSYNLLSCTTFLVLLVYVVNYFKSFHHSLLVLSK